MKRYLGIMVMCLALLIPMSVNATRGVAQTPTCTTSGNQKTCSFDVIIENDSVTEMSFTLTPAGGAVINNVAILDSASLDWVVSSTQNNGVWTVTIKSASGSPVTKWNEDVFSYTYTESGQTGCNVDYHPAGTQTTPTTPEKNPQTGSTLPYIALGAIAVLATGAYLATRNKAKMYKI